MTWSGELYVLLLAFPHSAAEVKKELVSMVQSEGLVGGFEEHEEIASTVIPELLFVWWSRTFKFMVCNVAYSNCIVMYRNMMTIL